PAPIWDGLTLALAAVLVAGWLEWRRQQARPDFDPATSVVLGVPAARMPLLVYAVAAFELFLLSAYFNPGFWILAFLAIVFALVLRFTVLGRYCYAIGSNEPT